MHTRNRVKLRLWLTVTVNTNFILILPKLWLNKWGYEDYHGYGQCYGTVPLYRFT